MSRPRLSIARAMAVVAVVAAVLASGMWSRAMLGRRRDRLADAAYHARRGAAERKNLVDFGKAPARASSKSEASSFRKALEAARLRVPYHAAREAARRRGAARPWEPSPPDPGEPGDDLIFDSMMFDPADDEFFTLSAEELRRLEPD